MSACPHRKLRGGFIEVLHADDCVRPGPTQDGIEYKEFRGVLYGRPDASLEPL